VESALCDVAQPDQVRAAVARTVEVFGQIDILVNNAGVAWGQPAEDLPVEKWRMVLETNLTGAFVFAQEAGRHMIERGYGRIINIASINGIYGGLIVPETHIASYAASKAGLIGLTRELAVHWARHGVRVNAIAPGYFQTRMTEKLWELAGARMKQTPMGRGGRAGELKGVAVFLASAASDYVNGQCLVVDGGATLV
jgi:gluconate 5-dehydrogenase